MPWHTVKDHAECGEGKWAVVKDDGGEVEGCHMSEADAQKQMAALYANDRAADPKKPYGDVNYADPGYQSDGKKRYPLDTEAHVKAAWSYINQEDNAKKYTADQVKAIKGRIKAAGKKYGIEYSEDKAAQGLDIDVVRALGAAPEFRASDGGDTLGTLRLGFSAFNTWYRVDSKWESTFYERTVPGTFEDTIAEDRALMRVLFDHGFDPQIGNKVLGPIDDLREGLDSPIAVVPLFDTSYNRDLLPGLRAGVYGSSFRMRVPKGGDEWNDKPGKSAHNPEGIPERTIRRAKVLEFGPVTFPANPSATATVRSMTDYFYDQLRQRDTSAFEAAARAAGRLPDLTAVRTRSADGGEPDAEPGTGKAPMSIDDLRTVERALKALGAI